MCIGYCYYTTTRLLIYAVYAWRRSFQTTSRSTCLCRYLYIQICTYIYIFIHININLPTVPCCNAEQANNVCDSAKWKTILKNITCPANRLNCHVLFASVASTGANDNAQLSAGWHENKNPNNLWKYDASPCLLLVRYKSEPTAATGWKNMAWAIARLRLDLVFKWSG